MQRGSLDAFMIVCDQDRGLRCYIQVDVRREDELSSLAPPADGAEARIHVPLHVCLHASVSPDSIGETGLESVETPKSKSYEARLKGCVRGVCGNIVQIGLHCQEEAPLSGLLSELAGLWAEAWNITFRPVVALASKWPPLHCASPFLALLPRESFSQHLYQGCAQCRANPLLFEIQYRMTCNSRKASFK